MYVSFCLIYDSSRAVSKAMNCPLLVFRLLGVRVSIGLGTEVDFTAGP